MTGFLDGQVHESGGYVIDRSLRFSAASSNYLTRTFGSPTNNTVWTLSRWLKRGSLGAIQGLFTAGSAGIFFNASDQLIFVSNAGATLATSTRVFRDPSAHGHLHVTSNGTTIEAYWNNELALSYTGTITNLNSAIAHNIGRNAGGANQYFDGYDAEDIFVDGQALSASSFGETNVETGEWVAKPYSGTYGNNGSELLFEDGTSSTTLGNDTSGNNNDWTLTNFTRSAGVNDCWMKDVPAGNGEASAVQPSGNYAVLNPLSQRGSNTISKANLGYSMPSSNNHVINSIEVSSGRWYWEVIPSLVTAGATGVGIIQSTINAASFDLLGVGGVAYYAGTGNKYIDGVVTAYGASYVANDVIGVDLNLNTSEITFYKNNVSQGTFSISSGKVWRIAVGNFTGTGSQTGDFNFGQRSFAYTPPTGAVALCTSNLPTPAIKRGDDHFTAKTRTGTGAAFSVSAIRHAVDWLFGKSRSATTDWYDYDVNRGVQKQLEFNTTSAETTETTGLTAFNSDGYTGGALAQMNTNAATYIDYMMKAGGAPVSNTNGSITSQVSANTTAGFSVVKATLTASNATLGHGLGKAPKMIIGMKLAGGANHPVYHGANTSAPETDVLFLNTTAATADDNTYWNDTAPTTSIFSVGTALTGDYVFYCFAEIEGFSKAFNFTGNANADGQFVYLGFKPRFILLKVSSTTGNWYIFDTVRNTFNVVGEQLYPNLANAGSTVTTLDVVSNGFKLRLAGDPNAAQTYVGFAIAETPINYANAF